MSKNISEQQNAEKLKEIFQEENKENLSEITAKDISSKNVKMKKKPKKEKKASDLDVKADFTVKNKKKRLSTKGKLAIGTASVLAITGFVLYRNREPQVDLTNKAIIEVVSDDKTLDEVFDMYNDELVKANVNHLVASHINTVLSGETDIVTAIDKVDFYVGISDKLASYNLDEVLSFNGDLRSLTEEEKTAIETMNTKDLIKLIEKYDDMEEVDYRDFSQAGIDKCSLAMKLGYAEKIVNNQLVKYGSRFLKEYSELIIQSTILDETGLPISKYDEIQIKDADDDSDYEVYYYEPSIGTYYTVDLGEKHLKRLAQYKDFFDKYSSGSSEESFADYKKTALKAINDFKISMLKEYYLLHDSRDIVNYDLVSDQSNHDIGEKVKSLHE
ncbi:MAG: hypothetical protein IKO49_00740 [Bacilli bacterium]|nr:hypothetical protein [Bacilli bacterium]